MCQLGIWEKANNDPKYLDLIPSLLGNVLPYEVTVSTSKQKAPFPNFAEIKFTLVAVTGSMPFTQGACC